MTTRATAIRYPRSTMRMLSPDLAAKQDRYEALTEEYVLRMGRREEELIAAGHDAAGLTEWANVMMVSANAHDVEGQRSLVTEDVVWGDTTAEEPLVKSRQDYGVWFERYWQAFADMQFFVDEDPYIEFRDGSPRICVPWKVMGTFTGPLRMTLDADCPTIAPNGASFELRGADRYNEMVRVPGAPGGWQVKEARSDFDVLSLVTRLGLAPAITSPAARPLVLGLNALARAQRTARAAREFVAGQPEGK